MHTQKCVSVDWGDTNKKQIFLQTRGTPQVGIFGGLNPLQNKRVFSS